MGKKIGIRLSRYQRALVEKYGYAFDEISKQLEDNRENPDPITLQADKFYMEQLVGELSRSINHQCIPDKDTMMEVNEIAERIELALSPKPVIRQFQVFSFGEGD